MADWKVFVEGKDDRALVRCLLKNLGIRTVAVELIGGGVAHLGHIAPQIHRRHAAGYRIGVVLDANSNPQRRRAELRRKMDDHKLPIERYFLVPDDSDPGFLEALLEEMAVAEHRAIYDCFDAYENCLKGTDTRYRTPNHKARIYAYCEALGVPTGAEKKYDDAACWNLSAPKLEPLKQFLRDLVAEGA